METDLGFIKLDPKYWSKCKNISIDYAIMEKCKNLSVVLLSTDWSDLGDWNTVWKKMKPNQDGVSLSRHAHAFNCNNSLLRSENKNQVVVGIGLEDIIIIAMPDAVLVANKNKTQEIKSLVNKMKIQNISQAETFTKDYRPWGFFDILAFDNNFKVKQININPYSSISLQSHKHRSEHWVVVKGKAKVTINEKIKLIYAGESIFVPKGSIHRLENPSKIPVILIEVQIGSYLGEDDITRFEDNYSRT